jgi:hypothetical protein
MNTKGCDEGHYESLGGRDGEKKLEAEAVVYVIPDIEAEDTTS